MVIYEITATVSESLVGKYESFMKETHIPELLETGCFNKALMTLAAENRYRIQYYAPSKALLDSYLDNFAEKLRMDFLKNFPEGIEVSREVWTVISDF